MDHKLSKEARSELLEVLRTRYREASRQEKSLILDEVVALADCHRKHAIRLLAGQATEPFPAHVVHRRFTTRPYGRRLLFSGKQPIASAANA